MKLGQRKIDMQALLAPAALVILYVLFSFIGTNFFSITTFQNILNASYYIGFMDHANWANAYFIMRSGCVPKAGLAE